jgi:hypothetical protein
VNGRRPTTINVSSALRAAQQGVVRATSKTAAGGKTDPGVARAAAGVTHQCVGAVSGYVHRSPRSALTDAKSSPDQRFAAQNKISQGTDVSRGADASGDDLWFPVKLFAAFNRA